MPFDAQHRRLGFTYYTWV